MEYPGSLSIAAASVLGALGASGIGSVRAQVEEGEGGAAPQERINPIAIASESDCPPYGQHRFVDPTGTYYVVVKEEAQRPWWSQRARFSFARASEGRLRVNRLWRAEGYTSNDRPIPNQLSGDALIALGALPDGVGLPGTVLVSSTGWGFVAIAGWCDWHTHSNDIALTVIEASGEVTLQLRLPALFTDQELAELPFVRGPSSWLRGAWLDEEAELIVVVGATPSEPSLRLVDRFTGELRELDDDILYAALDNPDPTARATALTVLGANRGLLGSNRPRLIELLHDEDATVRLSAATVLDKEGDPRGFVHLQSVSLDPTARMIDRRAAVETLLRSHLDEAVPIVRPLLPSAEQGNENTVFASEVRVGGDWSGFVMSILESIGDEAIPRIVDIVLDDSLLFEYRQQAIDSLARLETESALTMLTTLVAFDDARISSRALRLLVVRDEDRSIPGRLCGVLTEGRTHQEATIARFFKNRTYPAAIEPLQQALARLDALDEPTREDAKTHALILEALAFQRGD